MIALPAYAPAKPLPFRWALHAVVHVHCMAPWWTQIHERPRRRRRFRVAGNVTFLPAPVAGYRIRHGAAGSVVEINPSHATAVELCRCPTAEAARSALADIARGHARPFLGEIGMVA